MSSDRLTALSAQLVKITDKNMEVYVNLARAYEAEFSNLTNKIPNELGIFELDTMPIEPYIGYLLYKGASPVGFCVMEMKKNLNDIAEFYIIPSMRKNKLGLNLAITIFDMHPGNWQVRQIQGAEHSKAFWRKVIDQYTQNHFTEEVVDDPDWGPLTRQQFISNSMKPSLSESNRDKGLFFRR